VFSCCKKKRSNVHNTNKVSNVNRSMSPRPLLLLSPLPLPLLPRPFSRLLVLQAVVQLWHQQFSPAAR
jgi:hypothetical protein